MELKAGSRLKSAVCATQVMVIAAPAGEVALSCGGAPMLGVAENAPADAPEINPQHKGGTLIGKRYTDAEGALEILCTKPGEGSLAAGGAPLKIKEAKALPSSD